MAKQKLACEHLIWDAELLKHKLALRFENISLRRGISAVFNHLSLNLSESRIGLIGNNGAGKSSFFRLICGLDTPQSGALDFMENGLKIDSPNRVDWVGMMFQNPDDQIIFPTVEEELAFSFARHIKERAAQRAHAREQLAARGLAHWAERSVGSLSHGQRQHVCWLALQAAAPHWLLLDEPFASLDLPGQRLLRRDIAEAPQQIIVSTHVLDPIRDFERVIWLEQGQVKADGDGQSVCAAYEQAVAQCTPTMR